MTNSGESGTEYGVTSVLREAVLERGYVVTLLVLVAMGIALKPATSAVAEVLAKRIVPLRKPLVAFKGAGLEGFEVLDDSVTVDGTADVGTGDLARLRVRYKKRPNYSGEILLSVYNYPASELKIRHTPEVCYHAAGFEVDRMGCVAIDDENGDTEARPVDARYVRMSSGTGSDRTDCLVIYGFCSNGRFFGDRNAARTFLAMPWNRFVYLAKIECCVQVVGPDDADVATEIGRTLVAECLNVLQRDYFPTTERGAPAG